MEKELDEFIYNVEMRKLWDEIKKIQSKPNCNSTGLDSTELIHLKSRLEDLELWRAKIHSLLISSTPTGKEKLSRAGAMLSLLQKK